MSETQKKTAAKRQKKVTDTPPAIVECADVEPVVVEAPKIVEQPKQVEQPAATETKQEDNESTDSVLNKKVQKPKKLISHAEKQIVALLKQLETLKATDKEMTKNKQIKLHHNIVDTLKQCIVEKPSRNTSSGFMKRVRISEALREFGMTHGGWLQTDVEMSRVDATKAICAHIQKMELGDPSDKRRIKMSDELKVLFTDVESDWISYPEIQKQIQQHFLSVPLQAPITA